MYFPLWPFKTCQLLPSGFLLGIWNSTRPRLGSLLFTPSWSLSKFLILVNKDSPLIISGRNKKVIFLLLPELKIFVYSFYYCYFWLHHAVCRILVLLSGGVGVPTTTGLRDSWFLLLNALVWTFILFLILIFTINSYKDLISLIFPIPYIFCTVARICQSTIESWTCQFLKDPSGVHRLKESPPQHSFDYIGKNNNS